MKILLYHSQYSYACPIFVVTEHLCKGAFGQNDLFAAGRCMEQLQLSVAVAGKAEMNNIQPGDVGRDAEDITVLDPRKTFVGDFFFREIVKGSYG